MAAFGPAIDQAVQIENKPDEATEALERLRSVLTFCGKRLGGSDPLTIPPAALDAIAANIDGAKNEVDSFVQDQNPSHLVNANINADGALAQLAQVPGIVSTEELIVLTEAINTYRETLEAQARSFNAIRRKADSEISQLAIKLESLSAEVQSASANLQAQIETERQKISTQASDQQKLFADAQESRSNTYTETLRKIQDSLSQTLIDHQGQFSTAQENRNRDFSATQADAQKATAELLAEHTKKLAEQDALFTTQRDAFVADAKGQLDKLIGDYSVEAMHVLDHVKSRHEEVEKLAGVIGNLGVTSGYLKAANSARNSMWLWQSVTIGAFIAVIVFAWYAFLPTMHGDFKWGAFAPRVFLTITIGVLAAYAVSQADRFFREEKRNRRLALELAAIDPFIALLPQDEQFKFKLEMGRRTFGQQDEAGNAVPLDKSPATTLDVIFSKEGQQALQTLVELVKNVPKK